MENLELLNTEVLDESISNAIASAPITRGGGRVEFAPKGAGRGAGLVTPKGGGRVESFPRGGGRVAFNGESYSNADASYFKSNKTRTLAFQKYANSKGYTPKLVEDGIWGSKTQAAWNKLGDDFIKSTQDLINKVTVPTHTPTATESVTLDLAKKEYEQSGSKLTFKEWVNSQAGRDSINLAAQIANLFAQGKKYKESDRSEAPTTFTQDEEKKPMKILGMSPVTFGVVTAGVIVVASIVAYKLIKK